MIIAIDGTAGVGKGTLAKGLAKELNLKLLDTGLLYRAVAYEVEHRSLDLDDRLLVSHIASELDLTVLDHPDLRTARIALIASKISVYPEVRGALLDLQRNFAYNSSIEYAGAILDGRDIGTVICPDATVKLFLVADIKIRAQRRYFELQEAKQEIDFEELLVQMQLRDEQDSKRATAPLKPADDAHIIDTTALDKEEVFREALVIIKQKIS